jgi:hypothetical protein
MKKYKIETENGEIFTIFANSRKDVVERINNSINIFRPRTARISKEQVLK